MWLEEDTRAALEWIDYADSLCKGCGFPKAETMNPANARAYEAEMWTCYGCATRDEQSRWVAEQREGDAYGAAAYDGLLIAVTEKDDQP